MSLDPALNLIKKFEGCRLEAYKDIVGIWTIGWGETKGAHSGQIIMQKDADDMLLKNINDLAENIRAVVIPSITDNQLCAMISFAYNLGIGAFYHSHLLTYLNAGLDKKDVAKEFLKWNHAGGKVVAGLTRRREAESKLFIS